ncbi:MAG: hypothetical protein Ct9H300mP8_01680 [Gammaproteobacteria bacterium]|nr:MAG: hypothetical protein Ct9H300mP8_01680 [Gammaproteobacteria bacterium]
MRDGLYQGMRKQIDPFAFDDAVSNVFPDMIRRSIPGYQSLVELLVLSRQNDTPRTSVMTSAVCMALPPLRF